MWWKYWAVWLLVGAQVEEWLLVLGWLKKLVRASTKRRKVNCWVCLISRSDVTLIFLGSFSIKLQIIIKVTVSPNFVSVYVTTVSDFNWNFRQLKRSLFSSPDFWTDLPLYLFNCRSSLGTLSSTIPPQVENFTIIWRIRMGSAQLRTIGNVFANYIMERSGLQSGMIHSVCYLIVVRSLIVFIGLSFKPAWNCRTEFTV